MSSNIYYGVKEAESDKYSFFQAEWLTSYQLLNKLNIENLNNFNLNKILDKLIYPNELVVNDSHTCIDILLLAKYTDKYGNLKLKSVLLSQLINSIIQQTSTGQSSNQLNSPEIFILSLPKDSYYWCDVNDAHVIPKYALRVGYDQLIKQFSYIGRMKIGYLFTTSATLSNQNSLPQFAINITHKLNSLIGTLTHLYEYIPAICLKLHDLSYLDNKKLLLFNLIQSEQPLLNIQPNQIQRHHEYFNHSRTDSLWPKLKAAIKSNNLKELDFNLMSTQYEVLCLKKQPASLKQLCKITLIKLEEDTFNNFDFNVEISNNKNVEINKSLRENLPNSIRNLLWPSILEPGECISKHGKMRSSNGIYELNINKNGALRFIKLTKAKNLKLNDSKCDQDIYNENILLKQIVTYEKNVESLLISKSGVYLIYDNKQETRKPTLFYKHNSSSPLSFYSCSFNLLNDDQTINHFNNLFDNTSYFVELSDNGFLRVVLKLNQKSSKPIIINILNLNEYFVCIDHTDSSNFLNNASIATLIETRNKTIEPNQLSDLDDCDNIVNNGSTLVSINVRLKANFIELTCFPVNFINVVIDFIKKIFQNLIFRLNSAHSHIN